VEVATAVHPLPPALVAWPLLAALLVGPLGRWREDARNGFVVAAVVVTFLGAVALLGPIAEHQRLHFALPPPLGPIGFTVDPFGMLFALVATFVWVCATLHSLDYLALDSQRGRYHAASLVALGATLGVVLAGNLITLFVFFELLGFVAYLLVIHTGTGEAHQASARYLWMTVLAGGLLLGGILLVYALAGTDTIAPLPQGPGTGALRWAAVGLLVLGFGVKAGMLPVHVWLPAAHAVAPSPASALLSGVMIKVGAYGIFRTVTALARPELGAGLHDALWGFSSTLGLLVLWAGIATMAIGVVLALGQHHAKRVLAWSSVSQMGFILTGFGVGGYLASEGAMGLAGGLLHVTNHALLKASFFLGMGAVVHRTGELDLRRLGGLWRRMPLTFALMVLASAGIAGVPLLNGFVSKCLIHHGLLTAQAQGGHASLESAELIYKITCAGTAAVFIRLIGSVFLGQPRHPYGRGVTDAPARMLVAMALLSLVMVTIGARPHLVLERIVMPGFEVQQLPAAPVAYFLDHYFLSLEDLRSAGLILVLGAGIALAGRRFGVFDLRAPAWVGVDFWYGRLVRGFLSGTRWIAHEYEILRHLPFVAMGAGSAWGVRQVTGGYQLLRGAPGAIRSASGKGRHAAHARWERVGRVLGLVWRRFAPHEVLAATRRRWAEWLSPPARAWRFLAEESTMRAARLRVERYARDMSVSVALIFFVLLLLLAAIGLDLWW
jgi:formate hydrogenlyase subunit 3/multisubunit Na+/H+ antiporter MnhD subunit